MPCTGHNTLIPLNPLDKAGETEAQFEKGEINGLSMSAIIRTQASPPCPPSLGRRLQFPRDE